MKYSESFERDWNWYYKYRNIFTFDGSYDRILSYDEFEGYNAKHCFYILDSKGKVLQTNEPRLLTEILKCKGSINLHIKMWAEDRAKGILPKIEFEKIIEEFELLPWMTEAVEKQKFKYYDK